MLRPLIIFFALTLLVPEFLFSQTVLMEQDVNKDTIPLETGPNLKKFYHFYFGSGLIFGNQEKGAHVTFGNSTDLVFGLRFKRKLNGTFAIGYDASYRLLSYNYEQFKGKSFPSNTGHKREKLNLNNLNAGLYSRINLGRRGNFIGNFIDLGVYGEYVFAGTYKVTDFIKSKEFNENVYRVTRMRGLDFLNPVNYGLAIRAGINKFVFYANYRLSEVFDNSKSFAPEPPRYVAGIQISFHK